MADSRTTLLVLLVLAYFIFANDSGLPAGDAAGKAAAQQAVNEARNLLAIVGNATYHDINTIFDPLTNDISQNTSQGFHHAKEYNWKALEKVQERARSQVAYALGELAASKALDDLLDGEELPLYTNISGDARGRWTRSQLYLDSDVPQLNFSDYTVSGPFGSIKHSKFDGNFTGASGDVVVGVRERELSQQLPAYASLRGKITTISAELTLTEDLTEQEEEFTLRGVHFSRSGHSILTTTSTKFAGIFALPLFTLSTKNFGSSRLLLNQTISKMLTEPNVNPWNNIEDSTQQQHISPKCELIVYLQQMPIDIAGQPSTTNYDKELRYPTGAPYAALPKLRFSMLVYSPDCGFIIESEGPPDYPQQVSNHLSGYKTEILQTRARHHMLLYGLLVVLQLVSLVRQMRDANTPSTRSRVSFFSIAMMVFADAFATIILTTLSLFLDTVWITILGGASFSMVTILLFGLRFLSDIWAVHAPERRRLEQEAIEATRRQTETAIASARERQQAAYAQPELNHTEAQSTAITTQEAPDIVDFGSLPVFMPSDQAGLRPLNTPMTPAQLAETRVPTFGSMYMRFSFLLIITLFISISAVTYPSTLRHAYFTTLAMIYTSFWVPQILRNVQRNCRRALRWEFVVSQSILRILPMAYFFGWSGNVLFISPSLITLSVMAAWLWLQVVMLVSQDIIGPRWFVKKTWVSPAWDYHPILRSDLEGTTLPLGLADSVSLPSSPAIERRGSLSGASVSKSSRQDGKRVFDCAICMQDMEVPVIDAGDSTEVNAAISGSLLLARRAYMVTPCRHIFHTSCLEGWMKYRLQCPICREGLPPL